ncbi:hypothetical protein TRVA0_041S01332 [Trichomonascus vanleenenianus]|uniref:uncharacterized protein n=1 Tax=Trichomonascus vanleenenianus TaxID=2268995 RepID=UPI003EC98448
MNGLESDETASAKEISDRIELLEEYLYKTAEKMLADPPPSHIVSVSSGHTSKPGTKPSSKTAEKYKSIQEEFVAWYNEKFSSHAAPMVNSALVVLFLFERVISGTDRSHPSSLARAYRKCREYHVALQDLWWSQRRTISNPFGPLTEKHGLMTQFIELQRIKQERTAQLARTSRSRKRLSPTSGDIALIEKLAINSWYMAQGDGVLLRNRALLLLDYHFSLEKLGAERINMNSLVFLKSVNAGFLRPASTIGLVTGANKIGPHGAGLLRNRNVEVCPISAIAIYLFWRYNLSGERFPDFLNLAWQSIPLFPKTANIPTEHILPQTRRKALKEIFEATDLDEKFYSTSKTTRSAGQWQRGKVEEATLTSPKEAVCIAGFSSGDLSSYHVPRGDIQPPPQLSEMVFPGVTEALESLYKYVLNESSCRHIDVHYAQYLKSVRKRDFEITEYSPVDRAMIGIQILTVLKELRTVILQDAALLKDIHPQLKVWRHEIFRSSMFEAYAQQLQRHVVGGEPVDVDSAINFTFNNETSLNDCDNGPENGCGDDSNFNLHRVAIRPNSATSWTQERLPATAPESNSAPKSLTSQQLTPDLSSRRDAANSEGCTTDQIRALRERLDHAVAKHGEISTTLISVLARMEETRCEIGFIKEEISSLSI